MAERQEIVQPEQLHFKDDGIYPGSVLPVLLYRAAITADAQDRASVFERGFAQNDWRNSWRNGVYSFAHYHSTAHEALGVYSWLRKDCDSAASMARPSRSAPATSFSFRQVSRITTSARVRILAL